MAFPIPGAAARAQRRYCLVAPPGTLTLAAHPMALPATSRSALTTPPIDTLSPLAPDTAWPYDEVISYVELKNMVGLQGPGIRMKRSCLGQGLETHHEVIAI